MKKYKFIIPAMVMFFVITLIISNIISYRKGFFDKSIADIPGHLITMLQMYSMRTNLPENVPGIPSEDSVKFRLYATLEPLESNYENVFKLQSKHYPEIKFNRKSFERNIKIAKEIVQDVEVVTIGKILSPFERTGSARKRRLKPAESRE